MGHVRGLLRRIVAFGSIVGLLGGCSATQYGKPVADFAKATADARDGLEGYSSTVIQGQKDLNLGKAVAQPVGVRPHPGDCGPNSPRCRIVLLTRRDDPAPLPLSPESPIPNIIKLMSAIAAYAGGLEKIVNSDAAGQVEANVIATGASVARIAELVPGAGPVSFAAYAQPVSALAGWVLGQYVESVKLDALKYAVSRADPVIGASYDALAAVAAQATNEMRTRMAETISSRRDTFRDARTRENLESVVTAAEAYDALLRSNAAPDAVFKDLVKAHADLNKALHGQNVSLASLIEQIGHFQAQAEKLAQVIAGFQKAQKK